MACPVASQAKGWPIDAKLPRDLRVASVVLVDHVESAARQARKIETVGAVPAGALDGIDARPAPLPSL